MICTMLTYTAQHCLYLLCTGTVYFIEDIYCIYVHCTESFEMGRSLFTFAGFLVLAPVNPQYTGAIFFKLYLSQTVHNTLEGTKYVIKTYYPPNWSKVEVLKATAGCSKKCLLKHRLLGLGLIGKELNDKNSDPSL